MTRSVTVTRGATWGGAVSAGALMALTEVARATTALAVPLQISKPNAVVVRSHYVPLKGRKGGIWGNHKQCLYGVYGSQGQYKGLHYHSGPYHRGSPCGSAAREPGVIQFGNEPKFRPKPPLRLIPPSGRR